MNIEQLTEFEADVYQMLKKYLKNYKEFNLKTTLPYCFKQLGDKYSKEMITAALKSLIQKKYIIQGSSLNKEDILHNPNRKKILNFIQINPGAYNRLIRRELNLGSNEFNWHMGMLEKFGFIKKIRFQRSYGYFENKSYMNYEYELFLLRNEKISKLLKFIEKNAASISQISNRLEFHYNTVQKYLQLLEKRKFIISKIDGKHIYYSLNNDLMIKLQKIINGAIFIEFN